MVKSPKANAHAPATIACTICLVVALFYLGFVACTLPVATRALASAFDAKDYLVIYDNEQLVRAAEAGLAYSFADNDINALQAVISQLNKEVDSPWADVDPLMLPQVGDYRYVLTLDAISHLDDCYRVASAAKPICWAIILAGIALGAFIVCRWGKQALSAVLLRAPIALAVILLIAGAWAAMDFNGFFAFFHSLFFEGDSWLFPWNSLLISMYPEQFWVGMGIIWFSTSFIACLICVILGMRLKRR